MKNLLVLFLAATFLLSCGNEHEHQHNDYTEAMAHEHHDDAPTANEATDYEPRVEVVSVAVPYGTLEGTSLNGYMAEPADAPEGLPAVILIHEWWGLNDNIKMMTRRLAGEGYRVLAVDFYGGNVATDSQGAQQMMRSAMENPEAGLVNLEQAASFVADKGSSRTGIMGWCFGGAWTLNAAIAMSDNLDAGVIYYGRVNTNPVELANIKIPLLGIFGEEDGGIPVEGVREFERVLADLGKDADIHIYAGADHAFANPSGNLYEPQAAADAWIKTLQFLAATLK